MILNPFPAITAMIAASLLSGTASAQTKWVEINDDILVAPFNLTADEMEELDIYDAAGKRIAEVEEVIGTDATTPTALVIDFDDSAGYGQTGDIIVPFDQFEMTESRFVLNADADAISGLETYED
ncbi:PRC-barrel domain protein [Mesorhizobium sp. J18]|uniref:PRC-barrel domain-containing protein n=1 Tax=Mesorhizobium sp. J18 TaxID=935263 RepID=UPI00119A4C4A|nr:PRC-barrel domain-containing protein [Mesorhizobium sp. J18]TWG95477.1 PRC-barrel domain protein [Mesorhizobium sp. J18]